MGPGCRHGHLCGGVEGLRRCTRAFQGAGGVDAPSQGSPRRRPRVAPL